VEPYREAVEKWESVGGSFDVTEKMIHFAMVLNGYRRRVVRCRTFQVSLVSRKDFRKWSQQFSLYDNYLDRMDESAVVGNLARSGKQWVNYDKIGPEDIRVLLRAGMALAESIR
jgi:hypothetical protein